MNCPTQRRSNKTLDCQDGNKNKILYSRCPIYGSKGKNAPDRRFWEDQLLDRLLSAYINRKNTTYAELTQ